MKRDPAAVSYRTIDTWVIPQLPGAVNLRGQELMTLANAEFKRVEDGQEWKDKLNAIPGPYRKRVAKAELRETTLTEWIQGHFEPLPDDKKLDDALAIARYVNSQRCRDNAVGV